MNAVTSVSDLELRARLSAAVSVERLACADVIHHLAELDRRKLHLEDACSSLFAYCVERLGYSQDGALKRVRVVRLVHRFPRALDELASGAIHLTGLFLISGHLTEDNAEQLVAEARGKSKRQLEQLLARWFPRQDVPATLTPIAPEPAQGELSTWSGAGSSEPPPPPAPRLRVEPLSPASVRVELTASAAFHDKLEHARNLLSHAVPSGDLATILELGLDRLIAMETKRRSGAGKPRKSRETKPSSRHVPVEVQRVVRERDRAQCTFVDAEGRRCSEKRFLTIEHIDPFAKGGATSVDNCCLLCQAHNAYRARQVFGEEHIRKKVAEARARREANSAPAVEPEPDVFEKVLAALVRSGFKRPEARRALEQVGMRGVEPRPEPVLRRADRAHTLRRFGHAPTRGRARQCPRMSWQRQRHGHECRRREGAHHGSNGMHHDAGACSEENAQAVRDLGLHYHYGARTAEVYDPSESASDAACAMGVPSRSSNGWPVVAALAGLTSARRRRRARQM